MAESWQIRQSWSVPSAAAADDYDDEKRKKMRDSSRRLVDFISYAQAAALKHDPSNPSIRSTVGYYTALVFKRKITLQFVRREFPGPTRLTPGPAPSVRGSPPIVPLVRPSTRHENARSNGRAGGSGNKTARRRRRRPRWQSLGVAGVGRCAPMKSQQRTVRYADSAYRLLDESHLSTRDGTDKLGGLSVRKSPHSTTPTSPWA